MIAVIAKIPVNPGSKETVLKEVKALVSKVAKEKGTLHYTFNIDENDPDTLVVIERYKDAEAMGAHASTPYFQEFINKVMPLIGPMEIVTLKEIYSI